MAEPSSSSSSSAHITRRSSNKGSMSGLSSSRRRTLSVDAKNQALPAFASEGLHAGGPKLKVGVFTANIGNEAPTELDSWIPFGGGKMDVIAIGMQESTFKPKPNFDEAEAEAEALLHDGSEADDDEEDDEGPFDGQDEAPFTHDESDDMDMELASISGFVPLSPRTIAAQTAGSDGDGSAYLKRLIANHLGPQYVLVKRVRRLQMRLRVYVHRGLRADVRDVTCCGENTGLMGVVANKGGLAVSLRVRGTSLCFVSCHLAAHEGQKYRNQRNANVQEIIAGAHVGTHRHHLDLDVQFDHCFWMGDLNYRLDCSRSPELKDKPWAEQRAAVLSMIKRREWEGLYVLDELQAELKEGNVLEGFATPIPDWAPTFKVLRHRQGQGQVEYNAKRMPSYCDRVLFKSLPGLADRLALTLYASCPEFNTSDHKPLRAAFEVDPAPSLLEGTVIQQQPRAEEGQEPSQSPLAKGLSLREVGGRHPRLVFYDLSASDLPVMDVDLEALPAAVGMASSAAILAAARKGHDEDGKPPERGGGGGAGGACDPYLIFSTIPSEFTLNRKARAKTDIVLKSLNPSWGKKEVVLFPAVRREAVAEGAYAGLHILITCMDFDLTSSDDLIGFALLPATPLLSSPAPYAFDLPLRKDGLAKGRGRVRGWVRVEWPGDGETFKEDKKKKGRLPKHMQLAQKCCSVS